MSTLQTINASDLITNSRADINGNFSALNSDKEEVSNKTTDTTFAANSNTLYPSQAAVKAYVDTLGNVNASTTTKGIVEEATAAEVIAGTATGGTGARLFINPSTLPAATNIQTFTTTGADTWEKPTTGTLVRVQVWGAGGSGGRGLLTNASGGGGGGGAYVEKVFAIGDLGSTETISVGTGGAAISVDNTAGNVGGNTAFGASLTLVTAYGGGGGGGNNVAGAGGGGGGGYSSVGSSGGVASDVGANGGTPRGFFNAVTTATAKAGTGGASVTNGSGNIMGGGGGAGGGNTGAALAGDSVYGGGGGGGGTVNSGNGGAGGNSVYGGAGGGGGTATTTAGAGGVSMFGGAGGAGAKDATVGVAGSQPGGGGGGTEASTTGAGGNGKVVVTVF